MGEDTTRNSSNIAEVVSGIVNVVGVRIREGRV